MADEPISGLTETTSVTGNEFIPIVQSGVTKKIKQINLVPNQSSFSGTILFDSDITLSSGYIYKEKNTNSGSRSLTIPSATGNTGKFIFVAKQYNNGYNIVCSGGGISSTLTRSNDSVLYICDGSSWQPHLNISNELLLAISGKEPTITAGTTSQYWRGDKTWQTFPTISTPSLDEVTDVGNTTTNDITVGSATLSNITVSTLPFIDTAKKIISATGALLGTWFQTLTAKSTPVNADTIIVNDSASSFEAKKTTLTELWTNYLLGKVQALGYLVGSGLTTNNTLKWNGSQIVNANETDDGTTITTTLNRVFTGASASNNGTLANSNKFRFNGVNTIGTGSFIQVDPEMQFGSPAVGASLRGILYLDASANTYGNNGYTQLFINSGGDLINSKISLRRAIYINHRSADNVNNAGYNSSAVTIDATMTRPQISAVNRGYGGVHHITSVNADNYSSIIQAGASGSNPIHYSAYSQRDNALAYNHWKDASVSSGVLNHARNILASNTTTFSNGFGFKVENFIVTSNTSTYVALEEEVIVQSVGTGTTTSGKRYRHVNYTNGVASAYIMGLYAGGVIIGNTTALPNANASLHLQSTSKGFLPNVLTTAQRDAVSWVAGDAGMIIYNSTTNKHQGWNGTTWNDMY